jgi:serine phosphatase RsbU (regulator of sigma subunit)
LIDLEPAGKYNLQKKAQECNHLLAGLKDNENVTDMFSRNNSSSDVKDGMDITLCALDRDAMKLEFAGANNPMYLLRHGELTEIKGDKQPIGQYLTRKNFTNHTLDVMDGDVIYLFTDGYADQFGGPKGKNFKYRQMEEILISNADLPMPEQSKILEEKFEA